MPAKPFSCSGIGSKRETLTSFLCQLFYLFFTKAVGFQGHSSRRGSPSPRRSERPSAQHLALRSSAHLESCLSHSLHVGCRRGRCKAVRPLSYRHRPRGCVQPGDALRRELMNESPETGSIALNMVRHICFSIQLCKVATFPATHNDESGWRRTTPVGELPPLSVKTR